MVQWGIVVPTVINDRDDLTQQQQQQQRQQRPNQPDAYFLFQDNRRRADYLEQWYNDGGIMILGYDMFRNLAGGTCKLCR